MEGTSRNNCIQNDRQISEILLRLVTNIVALFECEARVCGDVLVTNENKIGNQRVLYTIISRSTPL